MHLYSGRHTHVHSFWQVTGTKNKLSEAADVPAGRERDRRVDFGELEGSLPGEEKPGRGAPGSHEVVGPGPSRCRAQV